MEFLGRNLPALVFTDSHKLPPHVHESWDGNCLDFFGISKEIECHVRGTAGGRVSVRSKYLSLRMEVSVRPRSGCGDFGRAVLGQGQC